MLEILKKFTKKQYTIFAGGTFLFLCSTAMAYAYFSYHKVLITETDPFDQLDLVNDKPIPTAEDPLAPYNVLLLGYGGGTHEGGEITDTMIVAHVEPKEKQVTLISIPRDIWVPLPIQEPAYYRKINHAYPLGNDDSDFPDRPSQYLGEAGGANLAKDMIELVTGLSVRYFAVINFNAFQEAIDTIGGISVNNPLGFTDEFYPIEGLETDPCGKSEEEIALVSATMSGYKLEQEFACRYETLTFNQGVSTMDGETALKFVRSRHSEANGNDFARAKRQQAVVKAIQNKLLSLGSLPKLVPLINSLVSNVRTDIGISAVRTIWSTHGDLSEYEIDSLVLSTDNVLKDTRSADRQYILVPKTGNEDWKSIHSFIYDYLSATDSATLQ